MPEDRDQLFERALARHLRAESAGEPSCHDAETLAAYHQSMLSPEELASAKSHISSCARCQEILAQLEATQEVNEMQEVNEVLPGFARITAASVSAKSDGQVAPSSTGSSKVAASSAKTKIIAIPPRRFSSLRWAAGAIAAALLIWIGVRQSRMNVMSPAPSVQVAENRQQIPGNSAAQPSKEFTLPKELEKQKSEGASADQPSDDRLSYNGLNETTASTRAIPGPPSPLRDEKKDSVADGRLAQRAKKPSSGYDFSARRGGPSARSAQAQVNNALQRADQRVVGGAAQADEAAPAAADLDKVEVQPPPAKSGVLAAAQPAVPPSPPPSPRQLTQLPTGAGFAGAEVTSTGEASKAANFKTALSKNSLDIRIAAPGGKKIWSVGSGGKIFHSTDSGRTWLPQISGVAANLLGGSAPSDKVCWIAGTAGTLLRTVDGGDHWETVRTPIATDLAGVHASDAQHASIWDAFSHVNYETSDGGKTWKQAAEE